MARRRDRYENPLTERYASAQMVRLFSPEVKFRTWRRLWIALAEAERELGLGVTRAQIAEMRRFADRINYSVAERFEKELRHDVMSHVKAFGKQCPKAAPIIHLGATSCFVGDNTDLVVMREALRLLLGRLGEAARALAGFCRRWRKLPILGLTHLQPAQPTTVGKRASLWLQDLLIDASEIERRLEELPFRSIKGATGTQATFLQLLGSSAKVKRLEKLVARKMGFKKVIPVSGQTYTRKLDGGVLSALAGLAESAGKFGNDLRILAHRKEVEEPFRKKQIGSSAMAYKRNPMRSERMCGLARYLLALAGAARQTSPVQWMERTLDDSAPRRLYIPEGFMAAEAIAILWADVAGGMVVYPATIRRNLAAELPFMATEELLMAGVARGGDRQELHEVIRRHSQRAARRVKAEGGDNNLLERLAADPAFSKLKGRLKLSLEPERFVGRAPEQVAEFLREVGAPALRRLARYRPAKAEVRV